MLPLTAIFVDLENLRKNVFDGAYEKLKLYFNYNNDVELVVEFCKLLLNKDEERLYRIFFYTAKPTKEHPKFHKINAFLNNLEKINHVALRKGKLIKRNNIYVQKQVDMLLGLDIADVTIKKYVDNILVVGFDSDMSPALKLARTNGAQSQLVQFDDLQINIVQSLLRHCDKVKHFKVKNIYEQLNIPTKKLYTTS